MVVKALGALLFSFCALCAVSSLHAQPPKYGTHFETSDRCVACHNGLTTATGEDISIGVHWRTSMMANSGRDPYWMASVRRETIDHQNATISIEDECTICHMPMMRYEAKLAARNGEAFAHLPPDPDKLAAVSYTHLTLPTILRV